MIVLAGGAGGLGAALAAPLARRRRATDPELPAPSRTRPGLAGPRCRPAGRSHLCRRSRPPARRRARPLRPGGASPATLPAGSIRPTAAMQRSARGQLPGPHPAGARGRRAHEGRRHPRRHRAPLHHAGQRAVSRVDRLCRAESRAPARRPHPGKGVPRPVRISGSTW